MITRGLAVVGVLAIAAAAMATVKGALYLRRMGWVF